MTTKLYMVVLIVGVVSILHPTPAEGLNSPKFSSPKALKILSFDKIKHSAVFDRDFPQNFKQKAEEAVQSLFVYVGDSPLADCYREDPWLYGFMTLFSFIAVGLFCVVFHMVRNDPRFY